MKKLVRSFAVILLAASLAVPSYASELKDAQNQAQDLQNQMNAAENEKKAITEKLKVLSATMKEANENLENKRDEIEAAEQELLMAKLEEESQYQSMKLRIKYMYENGNMSLIQIFLESESISEFLNKAEYMITMSKYDRERLQDFQYAVQDVEEKEQLLQAEYTDLEQIQNSLISQKSEAEALLKVKDAELDALEDDLKDVKAQIAVAEEAERKRQEAEEAKKHNDSSNNNSSGGSSSGSSSSGGSSSGNSSSGGGSLNTQTKPPVITGNGYFTHPCPGMSYQSSYFEEVREGIGDTRPHKGHDYAAAEGTPIYAAAAGTVMYARYSTSAGYWVVIDHGNGLVTKYMHMFEMPYVKEGQKVAKGQHIGGVGNTGQSFGNHLHFQVEEYGKAVNPSKYL